jgi:hypothetical protein
MDFDIKRLTSLPVWIIVLGALAMFPLPPNLTANQSLPLKSF